MLLLQYLDMDRCASLFTIHKSIGALEKLKFLSLRECKNLFRLPEEFNILRSLTTLDLYGCSKFTKLPLGQISTSPLQSLVYLDLSFCNITTMPDVIGGLSCLERLNLQGNKFTTLPSTMSYLRNLSYLNLSHCHRLQTFPELPIESGRSDLAGRYFKTTSESRNHRSGLYIFDSANYYWGEPFILNQYIYWLFTTWVIRLVKEPLHYRCGFDIIFPWHVETNGVYKDGVFSELLFHFLHRFNGDSIVRINSSVIGVDWVGFLFCVRFESNNHNHNHESPSSPPLPCPFYLSFESEHTEERFDMRMNLELNQVQGRNYIWMIFISREHCHFVETGAEITFKACKGLVIKEWGLCVITNEDAEGEEWRPRTDLDLQVLEVKESRSGNEFEPKIQLPYNWLVSDEDEAETVQAKGKEIDLFNLGLYL
ncbi:unnamed protein product [Lathyrus oleraceus]|uniref:Uncharacterized protein n=2 Tax=Pisum sativum TaxID=3888 RepID=A0A9D4Y0I9_PEA|nr:hypothetical protein KIW84_034143 [Pisum sativum]